MGGIFSYDNPLMRFLNKIAICAYLNILWLIFSLPVITIGASTTALYYVSLKLVKDEEGNIFPSFYKAFRENFKTATICWMIYLFFGIILGIDALILTRMGLESTLWIVVTAVFIFVSILYTMIGMYLFPLIARFDNTFLLHIKNSFILSVRFLFATLLMIVIHIASLFILYLFPPFFIICTGLTALLCSFLLVGIFEKIQGNHAQEKDNDETINNTESDG